MAYSQKRLFEMMERMPAFPHSSLHILQLTTDINFPPRELVKIIDQDPVLTMHLLKLVNSESFSLSRKITSIKQAVVFLGLNTIKNLALSIAPLEMLSGHRDVPQFLIRILRHSIATAIIAKRLARTLGFPEIEAMDYYVAGLLHDFGKVALYRLMPETYGTLLKHANTQNRSLTELEQEKLGTDHAAVGEALGRQWRLPEMFLQAMGAHHDPEKRAPSPLLDCVFAADQISKKLDHGDSGNPCVVESLPHAMVQRFGKDLDALTTSLGMVADEINKAQIFLHMQNSEDPAPSEAAL